MSPRADAEHWRYRDHPRVPPIVGVVDEGWQIVRRSTADALARGAIELDGGAHGYDPAVPSMHGVFVAAGPAFRAGVSVPTFQMVDVYLAVMRALDLPPAPHEGNPAALAPLFLPAPAR